MERKVLVIGADHHNTLGVVESFALKGIKPYVVLLTQHRHSFVLHSRWVAAGWRCSSEEEILSCLQANFTDIDNRAIVIATNDIVASILDRNHKKLSPYLILPTVEPAGTLTKAMEKERMSMLAREVGLNVPDTWLMTDRRIPDDVRFPVITKALSSVMGGKDNIAVCRNHEELLTFIDRQQHCSSIQIQQYIDKQYEFQLLGCSFNGGEEVIIPGRTHIDRPNGMDNTFFLRFDRLEPELNEIVDKASEFVRRTRYSGPFSIEFLRDKSGKDYFTEMNFRNDGNAYCVTHAGVNIPYIIYLYHTDGDWRSEFNRSDIKPVYLMPEVYYATCLLHGEFGFKEWSRNMRRADCFTTFFRNDPIPFFFFLLWGFCNSLSRVANRLSPSHSSTENAQ